MTKAKQRQQNPRGATSNSQRLPVGPLSQAGQLAVATAAALQVMYRVYYYLLRWINCFSLHFTGRTYPRTLARHGLHRRPHQVGEGGAERQVRRHHRQEH